MAVDAAHIGARHPRPRFSSPWVARKLKLQRAEQALAPGLLIATLTLLATAHYQTDFTPYIVIAAGGHSALQTKRGDSLIAFALPE